MRADVRKYDKKKTDISYGQTFRRHGKTILQEIWTKIFHKLDNIAKIYFLPSDLLCFDDRPDS